MYIIVPIFFPFSQYTLFCTYYYYLLLLLQLTVPLHVTLFCYYIIAANIYLYTSLIWTIVIVVQPAYNYILFKKSNALSKSSQ